MKGIEERETPNLHSNGIIQIDGFRLTKVTLARSVESSNQRLPYLHKLRPLRNLHDNSVGVLGVAWRGHLKVKVAIIILNLHTP